MSRRPTGEVGSKLSGQLIKCCQVKSSRSLTSPRLVSSWSDCPYAPYLVSFVQHHPSPERLKAADCGHGSLEELGGPWGVGAPAGRQADCPISNPHPVATCFTLVLYPVNLFKESFPYSILSSCHNLDVG